MLKVKLSNGEEISVESDLLKFCYDITHNLTVECIGKNEKLKIKPNNVSCIQVIEN